MTNIRPFHLAIAVNDLVSSREFYGKLLNLKEGRSSEKWVDWDFFGHQLVTHVAPDETGKVIGNEVDGHNVPCRHFGVVMEWDQWHQFRDSIVGKVKFVIEPYIRFKGLAGEQATMFFLDPSNNALEFKAFKNDEELFRV